MRTCGLSHQIMGPTTVKMAKTGFMGKIAKLQLEVPYFDMIVQKCACEKSIIITFITQAQVLAGGWCYFNPSKPHSGTL